VGRNGRSGVQQPGDAGIVAGVEPSQELLGQLPGIVLQDVTGLADGAADLQARVISGQEAEVGDDRGDIGRTQLRIQPLEAEQQRMHLGRPSRLTQVIGQVPPEIRLVRGQLAPVLHVDGVEELGVHARQPPAELTRQVVPHDVVQADDSPPEVALLQQAQVLQPDAQLLRAGLAEQARLPPQARHGGQRDRSVLGEDREFLVSCAFLRAQELQADRNGALDRLVALLGIAWIEGGQAALVEERLCAFERNLQRLRHTGDPSPQCAVDDGQQRGPSTNTLGQGHEALFRAIGQAAP